MSGLDPAVFGDRNGGAPGSGPDLPGGFRPGDRVFPSPACLARCGIPWEKRHDHGGGGEVLAGADRGGLLLVAWDNGEAHAVPPAVLIPEADAA